MGDGKIEMAIRSLIVDNDAHHKLFVWTKTPEGILVSVAVFP